MSELLVREQHRLMSHAGASTLVTAIRASCDRGTTLSGKEGDKADKKADKIG